MSSPTRFSQLQLTLKPGVMLTLEGNSKITRDGGSFEAPAVNSLSLPSITCCPGSTPACRAACYTVGMPADITAAHALNAATIGMILMSPARAYWAAEELGKWIALNCEQSGFRWHASGDVMHARHAAWIVDVCEASASIEHWIYTRSLELVAQLSQAANLVVNVSADEDNYEEARAAAEANGVRLCYLTKDGKLPADLPVGSVLFPDYILRGRALNDPTDHPWWRQLTQAQRRAVCPPDFFAQSPALRCGPCTKCLKPLSAGGGLSG